MGRRKHTRVEISHTAEFLYKEHGYPGCQIRNFSKGGLFITWGDSALATVMEAGFYEPEQRERAIVELQSGRFSANVKVAYVNQTGMGVAFVDTGQTLFAYLQDYMQDAVQEAEVQQQLPMPLAATQSIIQRLQGKVLDFLKPQLRQFSASAKEDLIAATDRSNKSGEQGDLFFALRTLETEEEGIRDGFFTSVEAGFTTLVIGEPPAGEQTREDGLRSELELIDKEEFDDWILLDGIAHKIESRLMAQIHQLDFALSHLFQRPIKHESNPISPIALLLQMKAALGGYALTPKAKKVVYHAFSRCIFSDIHRLYGELIACLNQDGIKTERSVNAPGAHLDSSSQIMNQAQSGNASLENLSLLSDASHSDQIESSGQQAPYTIASRDQVLESMESMPVRGGLLSQLERNLSHGVAQGLALDPLTRAAIGASEELVGAIQQDVLLNEDVQKLVNQLEIPFIKESITDPRILENAQHPGRRFLEAVEGLAPYVNFSDAADVKGRGHNTGLQQLINDIKSGAISNISAATQQIELLHDKQKENFQRNCDLAIESCSRQQRLRQAREFVKTTLEEKLLGRNVSIALDRLFQYGWANLLIHTAMLRGDGSVESKAYLRIVELLLKLFRPNKPFKKLSAENASDLLKVIKKGFNDYPVYPEGAQQFTSELMQALVDEGEIAQSFAVNRIAIDAEYLNRLFLGHAMEAEEYNRHPVGQNWMDLVANLAVGDWIVQHDVGGSLRLVNLAWKSADLEWNLLVDGNGIKVLYADTPKLAALFAENKFGLLENRDIPVVDRAVQRILKDSYDSVQHEVSYDELTGLLNRRAFERLLTELLRGEMAEGDRYTIILLDVDQFGLVNDLCGFEGGDKLLQSISNILRTYLPDNAHLARTGDDEFAILVAQGSLDLGFQLAEEHRQAINDFQYTWNNQLIPVTASVGLVSIDSREQTPAALLKAVSSACSIAKQAGRNCTRIYRETDRAFLKHRELVDSVAVIEDALQKDKIVLVAQPITPLQEGAGAAHYEILMRVEGDDGRLQSPVQFILAAERYNLMRTVDRWVVDTFFETVNSHIEQLRDVGGFSINLSSQSMADQEFKAYLIQQIEHSSMPREKLGFEITETAMITDSEDAINFIKEIKQTGCSFYLDDFGSGYASFSYLKEMPVDYVKIDGIFIRDLLQDKASHEMVKAVTSISHFMNKRVIAEFVENQATADELRKIGVDYIQGYHIGRPIPLSQIISPLQQKSISAS